jgi:hypothetical protein
MVMEITLSAAEHLLERIHGVLNFERKRISSWISLDGFGMPEVDKEEVRKNFHEAYARYTTLVQTCVEITGLVNHTDGGLIDACATLDGYEYLLSVTSEALFLNPLIQSALGTSLIDKLVQENNAFCTQRDDTYLEFSRLMDTATITLSDDAVAMLTKFSLV